jgi:hypothetical protein
MNRVPSVCDSDKEHERSINHWVSGVSLALHERNRFPHHVFGELV